MNRWRKAPFFRLIIPFIAGILSGHDSSDSVISFVVLPVCIAILLLIFLVKRRTVLQVPPFITGIVFASTCWALGCVYISSPGTGFHNPGSEYSFLVGRVLNDVRESDKSYNATIRVRVVGADSQLIQGSFKVRMVLSKTDEDLNPGDIIYTYSRIKQPAGEAYPGGFNYRAFLAGSGIRHTSYCSSNNWGIVRRGIDNSVYSRIPGIRSFIKGRIEQHVDEEDHRQTLYTLLTGDKAELSNEKRKEFAGAGIMHVLAVSGLHVGIIYLLLQRLLSVFGSSRFQQIISLAIVTLVLGGYTLLTGMTPSVLRAALMFFILLLARNLGRRTNLFNGLVVSAFILLLAQPYLVYSIGFQLSYLAVAGIGWIYPWIKGLWSADHKLHKWLRDMTGVSLAAQTATSFVAVHYFHLFPVYFLFANLTVVPLLVLAVYIGIGIVLIGGWTPVGNLLGDVAGALLGVAEFLVGWINKLPSAVLKHLFLDGWETILWMMLTALLLAGIMYRDKRRVVLALIPFAGLTGYRISNHLNTIKSAEVRVVKGYEDDLLIYRKGNSAMVVAAVPYRELCESSASAIELYKGRHDLGRTMFSTISDSTAVSVLRFSIDNQEVARDRYANFGMNESICDTTLTLCYISNIGGTDLKRLISLKPDVLVISPRCNVIKSHLFSDWCHLRLGGTCKVLWRNRLIICT